MDMSSVYKSLHYHCICGIISNSNFFGPMSKWEYSRSDNTIFQQVIIVVLIDTWWNHAMTVTAGKTISSISISIMQSVINK